MGNSGKTDGSKLFVANFPYETTEEQLRDMFAEVGTVAEVYVATDKETGKPRGFGFVTMGDAGQAQDAIAGLDQTDFNGRPLKVSLAQPKPPQSGGGGGGHRKRETSERW